MLLETWLFYVVAVTIVLVIPGPTILLVISQVLQHGKRSATPLVAGVALGDFVAMVLSLAGLGVVLSTSAQLFLLIKWVGAVYLVYLGWSLWRKDAKARLKRVSGVSENSRILFRQAFLVTVLNPKGIVFFLAFLPQFVNPDGDRWLTARSRSGSGRSFPDSRSQGSGGNLSSFVRSSHSVGARCPRQPWQSPRRNPR